jgi:dTDP-4-dehydrorhamnose reductase
MRILLTGTTGQVGDALRIPLSAIGTVVPVTRAEFDLSQPQTLATTLDRLQPDLIVNPAAYTAVDLAEEERDLAFRANAEAPGAIAAWAARHDVPLLHFSTDYVFDGTGNAPWHEDVATGPLSVYGASKLAGERAIAEAGGRHLIARTSWVYAAKGKNFLRTIARLACERPELRIVADQIGAPTSAPAIADAVVAILRRQASQDASLFAREGGVVNLSCAGETSWHGFATAIVDGLKARGVAVKAEQIAPIATADYPTKATRPLNSRLDHGRLNAVFGVTMPTWQQALARELDVLAPELAARSEKAVAS